MSEIQIQQHQEPTYHEPTKARADGRANFGGHGVPPTADQLIASPAFVRPDLSHRNFKQKLVSNMYVLFALPSALRVKPRTRCLLTGASPFFLPFFSPRSWFVCGFCCLGGVLFGADIASMSAVLALDSYNNYFKQPSAALQGGISSVASRSFPASRFPHADHHFFVHQCLYLGRLLRWKSCLHVLRRQVRETRNDHPRLLRLVSPSLLFLPSGTDPM